MSISDDLKRCLDDMNMTVYGAAMHLSASEPGTSVVNLQGWLHRILSQPRNIKILEDRLAELGLEVVVRRRS